MTWMVGVDEAGYGPNLGPLVVAATCWRVEDAERWNHSPRKQRLGKEGSVAIVQSGPSTLTDLYKALRKAVCAEPDGRRIAIADSKALYKSGAGLALLERGVLSALSCTRHWAGTTLTPLTWCSLVDCLRGDPDAYHASLPWHLGFDCAVPLESDLVTLARAAQRLGGACHGSGVEPVGIWARLVHPAQFNELVYHHGNKAAALSHITLTLVREVVDRLHTRAENPEPRRTFVLCDKHGGRNRYGAILQHHFPEAWVNTVSEGGIESRYCWESEQVQVDFSFRVGGEEFLPTALASMTAKYLRELAMMAFNRFWREHLPDLRPTAGYPGDSRRFKADIAAVQRQLGIDDHLLWRCR